MTSCTNCGSELGVGQFCSSCGHPIPPPPKLPPPAPADLPPSPRFPMYVDEVAAGSRPPLPRSEQTAELPVAAPPPPRRTASWVAWLAAGVVLLLVAVLGGWLVTRGTSDGDAVAGEKSTSPPSTHPSKPGVVVPETAPPNQDVNGNPVRYDGENMLDGDPTTAWRMPGDGTGSEITVTLPAETRLSSVGIINGYAKSEQGRDWYHGNRRLLQVEWVFDDGSSVVQDLEDTTELQTVDVDTTTTHVVVRLREVSPPGKGPDARDYTAISELVFVGA